MNTNIKPVKITNGFYKLWSFEPIKLAYDLKELDKLAWAKRKYEIKCMKSWIDLFAKNIHESYHWGFEISTGSVIQSWHVDGSYNPRGKLWKYMLVCIITNFPDEGTQILLPSKEIIISKPWTVYLIRWNLKHRAPRDSNPRICLRWYFSPKEGVLR